MADQTPRLSINDILPPEILHCVFEHLEFDINHHEVLSACMRVCTLWHSLARPHFFVWISVWRDQERFSEFCRSHPDIAGRYSLAYRLLDCFASILKRIVIGSKVSSSFSLAPKRD